jgi:hypothetical protein
MIIKVFVIVHFPEQFRLIRGKGKHKNELAYNFEELKKTEGCSYFIHRNRYNSLKKYKT